MDRVAKNGGALRVVVDARPLAVGNRGTHEIVQRNEHPDVFTVIKAGLADGADASVLGAAAGLLVCFYRDRQWIVRLAFVQCTRRHGAIYQTFLVRDRLVEHPACVCQLNEMNVVSLVGAPGAHVGLDVPEE